MTIKDIAALAGVSKSTVSRVLNNSKNVDAKTREIVLNVVKETNFVPSAMARGLPRQGNDIIGVVLPEVDSSFFGKVVQGINEQLLNTQYTMLLCCTDNKPSRELQALRALRQQQVCGVILTSSIDYCEKKEADILKRTIKDINAPIVLLDRNLRYSPWDGIYTDNISGAYTATAALIDAGFTKIGAIISDMQLPIGQDRYSGFIKALDENNLPTNNTSIRLINEPASMQEIYSLSRTMIEAHELPEAIFLSNRIITNGFYKAILENNIRPGMDIHCIGFDYSEIMDILHLPYSYLERHPTLMGKTAADMLTQSISTRSEIRREYMIPVTTFLDSSLSMKR